MSTASRKHSAISKVTTAQPVQMNAIYKSFDKKLVLDNVSIAIKSGSIFGLIGLNGVGKTTLIKIMLGLLEQSSGEVHLFGQSIHNPATRKLLFYLPEKFHPSIFLKGHEFLALTLSYYGKPYERKKAYAGAERLHLSPEALNWKITQYSKGMVQKLGLLSGLLTQAPLFILDEPMSGLDPRARILLKRYLQECTQEGRTVFFSSHILSDIEEICDTMAVLHDQKILFFGKPLVFRKHFPARSLEASFLKAIGDSVT